MNATTQIAAKIGRCGKRSATSMGISSTLLATVYIAELPSPPLQLSSPLVLLELLVMAV
jgi:hypothetical protein